MTLLGYKAAWLIAVATVPIPSVIILSSLGLASPSQSVYGRLLILSCTLFHFACVPWLSPTNSWGLVLILMRMGRHGARSPASSRAHLKAFFLHSQ